MKKKQYSPAVSSYRKALDCLEKQKKEANEISEDSKLFFENRLI